MQCNVSTPALLGVFVGVWGGRASSHRIPARKLLHVKIYPAYLYNNQVCMYEHQEETVLLFWHNIGYKKKKKKKQTTSVQNNEHLWYSYLKLKVGAKACDYRGCSASKRSSV